MKQQSANATKRTQNMGILNDIAIRIPHSFDKLRNPDACIDSKRLRTHI